MFYSFHSNKYEILMNKHKIVQFNITIISLFQTHIFQIYKITNFRQCIYPYYKQNKAMGRWVGLACIWLHETKPSNGYTSAQ